MPRPIDRALWLAPLLMLLGLAGSAPGQDAPPVPAGLNPNVIPLDAPVVIVLRPSALLKRPALKAAFDAFFFQAASKDVIEQVGADSIEEMTLVLLQRDFKPGDDIEGAIVKAGVVVLKTSNPRDWKKLAVATQTPIEEVAHAGVKYSRVPGNPQITVGFYQPDAKTVIWGPEANVVKSIDAIKAGGEAKSPTIAGASAKTVAVGAVDVVWLRELLGPQIRGHTGTSVGVAAVGPVWEKTTYATVRLDVDDKTITLVADNSCTDEDGAKAVEKTVDSILTLSRNVAPEYLKMLRVEAENRPQSKELADLVEQAIKATTVTREGTKVRFQVSVKADLETLVKLLSAK